MKHKILVIETGGTFATSSVSSVRVLDTKSETKQVYEYGRVVERVEEYNVEFETIRPIFTLSENLNMELLNRLLKAMYEIDFSKYKGVIITHGTDTLAYTANIIGLLFAHKNVPIVFVSSNHPLDLPQSNGVDNFASALDFIFTENLKGVYVIYKDIDGSIMVHLATRVKQMDQVIETYDSFKNIYFGKMVNKEFIYNDNRLNPTYEEINEKREFFNSKEIYLNKKVMLINPYVGLRQEYYNFEKVDGVVYGVYHSGTFFTEEEYPDNSINMIVKKLDEYGIPLFLPEISSQREPYESVIKLEDSINVNVAHDVSLECLYAKALIGLELHDNIEDVNSFIDDVEIFFERVV